MATPKWHQTVGEKLQDLTNVVNIQDEHIKEDVVKDLWEELMVGDSDSPVPESSIVVVRYFTRKFPKLLRPVYDAVKECECKKEPNFINFYTRK